MLPGTWTFEIDGNLNYNVGGSVNWKIGGDSIQGIAGINSVRSGGSYRCGFVDDQPKLPVLHRQILLQLDLVQPMIMLEEFRRIISVEN